MTATLTPATASRRATRGAIAELRREAPIWIVAGVAAYVLGSVLGRAIGRVETSNVAWVTIPLHFHLAVLGRAAATNHLRTFVRHGVTRRHAVTAWMAATAAFALLAAGGVTGLFAVEHLAFEALDWDHILTGDELFTERRRLYERPDQYGLIFLHYVVVFPAMLATGWLIGAGYHRLGGLGGTLFLAPALVPALGTYQALEEGVLATLAVAVPTTVIGLAMASRLLRNVPIDLTRTSWP